MNDFLRLEAVLKEHHLTKAELARRLGKSIQYIYNICKGYSSVSMRLLFDIAAAIGCNAYELIGDYNPSKEL